MTLKGQAAIVTGAGRGIGRAIAQRLAAEGMRVALLSRTAPELEETARLIKEAGGVSSVHPVDVTDEDAVRAAFAEVAAAWGAADLLVNNAARFNALGPAWEVDPADWWRDVTVNIQGVFLCCRAVLAGMRRRRAGRIINLIGGGTGGPFKYGSGYGTSKAAVMRFTECLAEEVKEDGISVFAMGPGLVRTAMTNLQLDTEAGRKYFGVIANAFAEGHDVPPTLAAELAAHLASGRFDALTGRAFNAGDDMATVAKQADRIIAEDLRTLRMR